MYVYIECAIKAVQIWYVIHIACSFFSISIFTCNEQCNNDSFMATFIIGYQYHQLLLSATHTIHTSRAKKSQKLSLRSMIAQHKTKFQFSFNTYCNNICSHPVANCSDPPFFRLVIAEKSVVRITKKISKIGCSTEDVCIRFAMSLSRAHARITDGKGLHTAPGT